MADHALVKLLHLGAGAWNRQRPRRRPNLSGANLPRADLRNMDLSDVNLQGANLNRADLADANLTEATLVRAFLGRSRLQRADLRAADLRYADLREAGLEDADLRQADLTGADLRGADLTGADLADIDLTQALHDGSTRWPEGVGSPVPDDDTPRRLVRRERLSEAEADVIRWGIEPLLGTISELLDDSSVLSRQMHLDAAELLAVERHRSILIHSLQVPDPDAVVIARTVAHLARLLRPTEDDVPSISSVLAGTGAEDPDAAARVVVDIADAVTRLGSEDPGDDGESAAVIEERLDALDRHIGDAGRHSFLAAARTGVISYLEGDLPSVLKEWSSPKAVRSMAVAVVASVATATAGAARFGGPLLQYAISVLQAMFQSG